MEKKFRMAALDIGTSSVRTFLAEYDGRTVEIQEKNRFYHQSVPVLGHEYWDLLGVFAQVRNALLAAAKDAPLDSLALDSWGTDMTALDWNGEYLWGGVCARDGRFNGLKEDFFEWIPEKEIYMRTGVQFLNWNTLYLLYYLVKEKPWMLESISCMLFTPDLFNYFLTGEKNADYSIASTSQMLDPWRKTWDEILLGAVPFPREKLLPVTQAHMLGKTRESIRGRRVPVMSGCSHDTAAAVAGVPAESQDFVYIVCGSWAMIGIESDIPIVNETAARYRFTNEGGSDGRIRFLKNVMGMWMVQESRRQWIREGKEYSFGELAELGAECEPFRSVIDVDDARLVPPGDIPGVIRGLCLENGQPVPENVGQVIRCIDDSLALKFKVMKERLEECSGRRFSVIHIVAGGSQDASLCQAIADAAACVVKAGPAEASAYGNTSVQLLAGGLAESLMETREIVRRSVGIRIYEPKKNERMEEAFENNRKLFERIHY